MSGAWAAILQPLGKEKRIAEILALEQGLCLKKYENYDKMHHYLLTPSLVKCTNINSQGYS